MKSVMFYLSPICASIFSTASLAPPCAGPHSEAMPAAMQANGLAPLDPALRTVAVEAFCSWSACRMKMRSIARARVGLTLYLLARHGEGHVQEIFGIAQRVLRIHEGLAERIFERHRRDRRHLGDQAVGRDHPLVRVVDVGRVVIEGRERADHAAQHRHRVRVAAEPAEEGRELLVHHRVMGDVVDELLLLLRGRQLAVEQQVGDLHEVALLGELLDRIAAIQQHAFVAVDIGDARAAGRGRHEARDRR